jgi:hypothetical protein
MAAALSIHRQPSSNAIARRRDRQILWLLERHPAMAAMLVEIGLFATKARASKRLRRLVEKKQLRVVGTVSFKDGRPEHVYCKGFAVKADNLLHEVQLSRLCFKMHADDVRRGMGEVDPFLHPDAELLIRGQRFLLELDLGTMSYQEIVQTRFAKYHTCTDFVLWACSTEIRMEGLRSRAEAIRETALFTTVARALRDPHAPIWKDFDGESAALPRGEEGSPKGADKS